MERLYVDVYEDEFFREKLSDIADIAHLETSDYLWMAEDNNLWAMERKSITDFFASFAAGRLTDQLRRLVNLADHPLLLVEGVIGMTDSGMIRLPGRSGGLAPSTYRWSTYQDLLLEIQYTGVGLQFTTSKSGSAFRIRQLYEWSNRPNHGLLDKRLRTMEYGTRMDHKMYLLTALPGIGPEVAKQLLDQFATPINALAAFNSPEWLKDIKGLGEKKISTVRKVVFGRDG
jgi:ERCC4-type nuclease